MSLQDLRDKTGADDQTKDDLTMGIEAANRVLQQANSAVDREIRGEALVDLCNRVDDWKNHRVDQFGELLLHGHFPVVTGKSDVQKEVRSFSVLLNRYRLSLLDASDLLIVNVGDTAFTDDHIVHNISLRADTSMLQRDQSQQVKRQAHGCPKGQERQKGQEQVHRSKQECKASAQRAHIHDQCHRGTIFGQTG